MAKARTFRSRRPGARPARAPKSARPRRARLCLEQLEDRTLFSAGSSIGNTIGLSFIAATPTYQTALVSEYVANPDDVVLNRVGLNAGDVVAAQVNTAPYGGGFNSYLRIFQDTGGSVTQLASNDNAVGHDAGVTFQAPATGTYYIGVSSFDNSAYNPLVADSGTGTSKGLFDLSLSKTTAPLAPDLAGASFRASPNLAVWGDTVTVNYSVENRGGLDAAATSVSLLASADNRFDDNLPALQSESIPALAAGTSYAGSFTVQLGTPGTPLFSFNAAQQIFLGLQIGQALPASAEQGNDWAPERMLQPETIAASQSNATRGTATPIALNSRTSDVTLPPGAENFYQISVTQPGNLSAQVGAAVGSTSLSLFNSQGIPIVQSDGQSVADPDPSINQGLTGSADNGGTIYYIKVANRGGQGGGYNLTTLFTPSASTLQTVSVGASPAVIASGDFNGDGLTDLVTGNWINADGTAANDVTVLLANGDGTFRNAGSFDVGTPPNALAVGDFTGNGQLDIATTNATSNDVTVLLGNGDGTFQSPLIDSSAGGNTLAVGDFNGDGHLDLAVGNSYTNSVSILLGNGDGTFQPPLSMADPNGPAALAVGDFTGNGRLDLAVADEQANQVSILLGNGDGTFSNAGAFAVGTAPDAVVAGNFTGNGQLDLAVANAVSNNVTVLLGNGNGTFQTAGAYAVGNDPTSLVTADFTGDGRLDLATANEFSNSLSILLGSGDGTFTAAVSVDVGANPKSLAAGDFTGDGRVDLAAANYFSENVTVLLGNGKGGFPAPPAPNSTGKYPDVMVSGDFTGDGRLDLVVANSYANNLTILLGQGDGTFQNAGTFAAGADPVGLVAGDFNGDGRLDLAIADMGNYYSGPGGVTVLLGNGNGTFQPAGFYDVGDSVAAIVAGDFTGDGNLDMAAAIKFNAGGSYGSSVAVLLGDGHGGFTPGGTFATGGLEPDALVAGDFTGDGFLDLAVANYYSQNVSVLSGDGHGSFQIGGSYALDGAPVALTAGDFTGDGRLDLAVVPEIADTITILLNQGDGTFAPAPAIPVTASIASLATGDFTGDGRADLVASNYTPANSLSVFLSNGDGTFQAPTTFAAASPVGAVVGDFNGDDHPDIAVADYLNDNVTVLLGTGTGQFIDPVLAPSPVQSTPLVADFSGRPDAVVLTQAGQILFRQGLADEPGAFAPPITINPDPQLAARDIALVQTTGDVPLLAALDIDPFALTGQPGSEPLPRVTLYQSVLQANGDVAFTTLTNVFLPAGFLPANIASADLTGNGLGDLVITASASDQAFVCLQTAPGVFGPATAYSVGVNPSAIELVALNGASLPDIVVTDRFSGQVSVLLNQGNGTFAPEERFDAGTGLYDVAPVNGATATQSSQDTVGVVAGPFTGGPGIDLVALNSGTCAFTVLPGDGSGGFLNPQAALTDATGGTPTAIVTGHFITGDNNLDLAILSEDSGTISIYRGDGQGGFTLISVVNAGNQPTGLAVADVSRPGGGGLDGIPDLLIGNAYGDLLILTGNGDGTFSEYRRADQSVSLAVATSPSTGQNDFYFSDQGNDQLSYQTAASGTSLVAGPAVYQDRSAGVRAPGPESVTTVAGIQYLLVLNSGANDLLVYTIGANGEPIAASKQTYATGTDPVSLVVTNSTNDLNDDGIPDVVVANQGSNDVSIFLGQMTGGTWSLAYRARQDTGGIGPTSVAVADVTGPNAVGGTPGLPDLIVSNGQSNNVTILPNRGDGFFAAPISLQPLATGIDPTQVIVDGPNLITINAGSNDVTFIADFMSAPVTSTVSSGGEGPVTAALVDANGVDDLFVANAGNGALAMLAGGLNGFDAPQTLNLAASSYFSDLALVTAGNQLDLYGTNAGIEAAVLLGTFGAAVAPPPYLPPVPGFPVSTDITSLTIGAQSSSLVGVAPPSIVEGAAALLVTGLTFANLGLAEHEFAVSPPSASDRTDAGAQATSPPWGNAGQNLLPILGDPEQFAPPEGVGDTPIIHHTREGDEDLGRAPDSATDMNAPQAVGAAPADPRTIAAQAAQVAHARSLLRQSALIEPSTPFHAVLSSPPWCVRTTGGHLEVVYVAAESKQPLATTASRSPEDFGKHRSTGAQDAGQTRESSPATSQTDRDAGNTADRAQERPTGTRRLLVAAASVIIGVWCWFPRLAFDFVHVLRRRERASDDEAVRGSRTL